MHPTPLPLRRTLAWLCVITAALGLLCLAEARAEDDAPGAAGEARYHKILVVDFKGEIGAMTWAYVQRRVEQAEAEGVDCLVLRIDSPGGTVFHSEKIGDRLFGLDDIHTVAWVPAQALSGACMVAVACDEIVMRPAATLGDCQPILFTGGGKGYEEAGEKIESPLRAVFRKYAEKNGYSPVLAQAFVSKHLSVIEVVADRDGSHHYVEQAAYVEAKDSDEVIPGFIKEELRQVGRPVVTDQQLLTVTAREALKLGFMRRRSTGPAAPFPRDEGELLATLSAPDASIRKTAPTFFEKAGKVLLGLSGILGAIVALAAALTIFQGFGTISIIGGCALILMLLINATADQLNGFPIFLVLVGLLLLGAEAFLIPGFGVAGILGFLTLGVGFLFLATGTGLGQSTGQLTHDAVFAFGMQFVVSLIAGLLALLLLSRYFPAIGPGRRMVLTAPTRSPTADAGTGASTSLATPAASHRPTVGDRGFSTSALRPAGSAEFEGALVDVVTQGDYIEAGVRVRVLEAEGARIMVVPDAE